MALNKYYRNLKGRKLDEEYINEIKDNIKLTKDQRQAYKILIPHQEQTAAETNFYAEL